MECAQRFPNNAVVYIAKTNNLNHLQVTANWNKKHESEYIWNAPPLEFYNLCEGFVRLNNIRRELRKLDHEVSGISSKENLNNLCRDLPAFPAKKLKNLIAALQPFIEKV